MPYSRAQLAEFSKTVGRNWRTLQRWAAEGCRLEDPQSLKAFLTAKELRRTNIVRSRERRGINPSIRTRAGKGQTPVVTEMPDGNGEVPVQKTGAAFALKRLEIQEALAHRRLEEALVSGNPVEIEQTQMFWVRCVESLRKLDLSVELGRRDLEERVPKRLACDVALAISDWLRISFAVFLSSETLPLMGLKSPGEFKAYAFERFKSILHLTVRNSLKTCSPIPSWAAEKVKESWNVNVQEGEATDSAG
jgi:hypothetical protein